MRVKYLGLVVMVAALSGCVSKTPSASPETAAAVVDTPQDPELAGLESQMNSRSPASNDPQQLRFHCRTGNSAGAITLQKSAAHVYAGSGQVGNLYVEMWRDEGSADLVVSAGDASTSNSDLIKEKHVSVASGSFSVEGSMQDLSVNLTCTSATR